MRHLIASQLLCSDNNSPDAQVFRAVQNGLLDFCVASPNPDMHEIERYIQNAAELDMAAFAAAYFGKTELLEFFLDQVADKDMAIRGAAEAGNQSLVDHLITKGANKNVAVFQAAYSDKLDLMKHLLNVHDARIGFALNGAARVGKNNEVLFAEISAQYALKRTVTTTSKRPVFFDFPAQKKEPLEAEPAATASGSMLPRQ